MPTAVKVAILLMFAALTFYSVGVWASVLASRMRPWHAACFWGGFVFDTAGTDIMRHLAGGLHWSLHTATGAAALLLMLAHAIWATRVLVKGHERTIRGFHRFSVAVWAIWLIPFVTGLVLGGRRAH